MLENLVKDQSMDLSVKMVLICWASLLLLNLNFFLQVWDPAYPCNAGPHIPGEVVVPEGKYIG